MSQPGFLSRGALGLALALVAFACSSDEVTDPQPTGSLAFVAEPTDVTVNQPIQPAPVVELRDAANAPVLQAGISVALARGSGTGTLGGTTPVVTDAQGRATFSDLSLDVVEPGVTLIASTAGLTDATSQAFAVTVAPPVKTQLGFRTITAGTVRMTMAVVEVEIQDANGNLFAGATDIVTITLGTNPGNLLLHTSGISDNDRFIELVDPATPVVLTPELSNNETTGEMLALAYDDASGLMFMTARTDSLFTIDLSTGAATPIGQTGDADRIKGLAFQSSSGTLLAAQRDSDILLTVDPATGDTTALGSVTIAGDSITGFTGLDYDPTTATLYGLAKLRDNTSGAIRDLVTIDVGSLTATSVATMSENGVAAITFLTDGTLLAVTGDGATNGETLWGVDMSNGTMTQILVMGNGADGESIEAIPARLSGTFSVAAVNGVATFNDLQIDGSGTGYTFIATATGLTAGTSAAFDVNQ